MAKLGAPQVGEIGRLRWSEPTFVERPEFQSLTEGVSKLEQAPPCRTICTISGFCTGDFPVYQGLQEIKLLHGAARSRFDTLSSCGVP